MARQRNKPVFTGLSVAAIAVLKPEVQKIDGNIIQH